MGIALLSKGQKEFNRSVKSGEFDMSKKIMSHKWWGERHGWKSREWYKKYSRENKHRVFFEPDSKGRGLLEIGKLYNFQYVDAKYWRKLDYWDTDPVMLCIGYWHNKSNGNVRHLGINMHHLPIKIRQQVMITVFNMFRWQYKGEMYRAEQKNVPNVIWAKLKGALYRYDAEYALRNYIPSRRRRTLEIKYEDWPEISFMPSSSYRSKFQKTTYEDVRRKWRDHYNKRGQKQSQRDFEENVAGGSWLRGH